MTGPSGSPGETTTGSNLYVDGNGQRVALGAFLGSGGNAAVFAVEGSPAWAAKIFHRTPLSDDHVARLAAVVARRSAALSGVAAWPHSILYDERNQPCGLLLPQAQDALPLEELCGTASRREQFPYAKWHHLVHAARNVAAAFECLHRAGVVVGDVDPGNVFVDREMRVRLIGCDTFQLQAAGRTFPCPEGAPHLTPPELQAESAGEGPRTVEQDRFGLAVLVFHLLFVGRHPFAGWFYGPGELSLEQAIAERRFAFSAQRMETQMEPPSASLQLADVSPAAAELFEQAFRGAPDKRPAARRWVEELELVVRQCKSCRLDAAHVYLKEVAECPWCRIEDEGGPAFFVLGGSTSRILPDRLDHLQEKLRKLKLPVFPDLAPHELRIPRAIEPKRLFKAPRPTAADAASWLLTGGAGMCLAGAWSVWALAVGALASAGGAAWLIAGGSARVRRSRTRELAAELRRRQSQLAQRGRAIAAAHRGRGHAFAQSVDLLQQEYQSYLKASTHIHSVLAIYRSLQKNRFLVSHSIQRNVRHIAGMNASMAAALASYGVESAYDVDPIRLLGLPMINHHQHLELQAWRAEVERQFVYEPALGLSISQDRAADAGAINRFKASVARRILMAARQLHSAANVGRALLAEDLKAFVRQGNGVREAANELREFQSHRRPWEREFNRTKGTIAGVAVAAMAMGGALWWLNQ